MLLNARDSTIWAREDIRDRQTRKRRENYNPLMRRLAYERSQKNKKAQESVFNRSFEREFIPENTPDDSLWESSLIQVPFTCYHCGGRSGDIATLESHIKTMHRATVQTAEESDEVHDDNSMDHMLKINEMVEVQIKEDPDFLMPLDLSKKVQENEIWIKEEPCSDYEPPPDPIPMNLPKIRVASEEVLKAPIPPGPLLNTSAVPSQTPPAFPFGNYVNQMLTVRPQLQDPLGIHPPRFILPFPPILGNMPRIQPPPPPKPRMPTTFAPAAQYVLEVPYICHHCGGRSGDLETLKTHIETMHNPVILLQQQQAAEAKRKLLQSIADNKVKRGPKALKEPKEKKIRIKREPKEKKVRDPNYVKKTKKQRSLENRPYSCPFCNFKATNFPGLVLHARAMHEKERAQKRLEAEAEAPPPPPGKKIIKKPFCCLFCDYRGIQQQTVKKHMYAIHAKQKRLQCPFCPHRSAYSENMKWHIISKHKNKCPHCHFRAPTKATLLAHEKSNCKLTFFELPVLKTAVPVDNGSVTSEMACEIKLEFPQGSEPSHVNNNEDLTSVNNGSGTSDAQENGESFDAGSRENLYFPNGVTKAICTDILNETVIIKQEPRDLPIIIKTENTSPLKSDCES